MNSPADFHRLESRLRLVGRLVTRTGLHVGAAASGQNIGNMPVLKDGRGLPFIPGSTLKGVLRSTLEALVQGASNESRGLWACNSLDEKLACGAHEAGKRSLADMERHCAICRLFGSRIVASHVRASDAMLAEHRGGIPVELRDGVAIDRDLGCVAGNKKYQFEVVAPGVTFGLEVFVENPQPWLMGLLTLGWDQIADGFSAVGGFSSRGLGRLDVHWEGGEQFTAASLLAGEAPVTWDRDALGRAQQSWRAALAARLGGE